MAEQNELGALAAAIAALDAAIASASDAQSTMQKLGAPNQSLTKITTQLDALRDSIVTLQRTAPAHRSLQ